MRRPKRQAIAELRTSMAAVKLISGKFRRRRARVVREILDGPSFFDSMIANRPFPE